MSSRLHKASKGSSREDDLDGNVDFDEDGDVHEEESEDEVEDESESEGAAGGGGAGTSSLPTATSGSSAPAPKAKRQRSEEAERKHREKLEKLKARKKLLRAMEQPATATKAAAGATESIELQAPAAQARWFWETVLKYGGEGLSELERATALRGNCVVDVAEVLRRPSEEEAKAETKAEAEAAKQAASKEDGSRKRKREEREEASLSPAQLHADRFVGSLVRKLVRIRHEKKKGKGSKATEAGGGGAADAAPLGSSPQVLVVCIGATRAVALFPHLRRRLHCRVAKLFARHLKVEEQAKMLDEADFPVAIGTPNRFLKLIEHGALSLDRLELVVFDMNRGPKGWNVLDFLDVRRDAAHLYLRHMHGRVVRGDARIALL